MVLSKSGRVGGMIRQAQQEYKSRLENIYNLLYKIQNNIKNKKQNKYHQFIKSSKSPLPRHTLSSCLPSHYYRLRITIIPFVTLL